MTDNHTQPDGAQPDGTHRENRPAARALAIAAWALLGLAATATVLSAVGQHAQPVPALTLLLLLAGPGSALAWALPGQELPLRLLIGVFGGLAADAVIAQAMLTLRLWSPSGGALAALALTLVLLALRRPWPLGALGGRRGSAHPTARPSARTTDPGGSAAP
ncbi:hypothetical protein [Streptacidiphilus fuscans]|uniref:Uncharacterized protein n=1 Tax=Streptacidiphilus fuscans TaxID=2789292 RepID=A0A931FE18_9ACTN|nr:hypothetical protein [Streptacidiphilus fuscans]MBF9071282.1 hypothetical protein [Streptacidiphilus fuscans]